MQKPWAVLKFHLIFLFSYSAIFNTASGYKIPQLLRFLPQFVPVYRIPTSSYMDIPEQTKTSLKKTINLNDYCACLADSFYFVMPCTQLPDIPSAVEWDGMGW